MEQLFDNLSRAVAAGTSRRDAIRGLFGVLFGGATISAVAGCANSSTAPTCTNGCIGSDNQCYTCSGSALCYSSRINATCSTQSPGGIYCCSSTTSSGGSTSTCPCTDSRFPAYNATYGKCCPANTPWYDPGGHGYGAGCYASCPYVGDCDDRYTLCS